jgi:hypothetical protein
MDQVAKQELLGTADRVGRDDDEPFVEAIGNVTTERR